MEHLIDHSSLPQHFSLVQEKGNKRNLFPNLGDLLSLALEL